MRILFVVHQFFPEFSGGTERVTLNLARAAQRAGHHVHVLACAVNTDRVSNSPGTPFGAQEMVYQGVPLTLLRRSLLPAAADFSLEVEASLVQPLADWMNAERFDVCHVMHTMRMVTAVLAAQRCDLPLILTLTDFFLPCSRINLINLDNQLCSGPDNGKNCAEHCLTAPWSRDTIINRFDVAAQLLAAANIRVAPSEYVAQRYRDNFPGCDFRVIPHGIDLLAFPSSKKTKSLPREQEQVLRLGYVGGIIPQKGLDTLLRALASMPKLNVELKIIGGFHGAPAFHREVATLGDADPRVEFLGHLEPSKVFAAMQSLDVLCLPSRVPETFSLALHEASALGIPALVSSLGAPAEQVGKHGGGLVLAVDDTQAWAKAIHQLVENPGMIASWQARLPLPLRVEEEGFFYDSLYRTLPSPQPEL